MSSVDKITVSCTSVQTVQLSAQKRIGVVKTKVELNSHSNTCVVGDQCLGIHVHNRPVNVFGYDSKVGSKYACIVDATVTYDEPKTGQVGILLIHEAIEMKGLDNHFYDKCNAT